MINTPGTPQEKPIRTVKDKDKSYLLEIWDICYALQASLCSILNDEELDSTGAATAMNESLDEFTAVVKEAISNWSGGKVINIVKSDEVTESDLAMMKSAAARLNDNIEKAQTAAGKPAGEGDDPEVDTEDKKDPGQKETVERRQRRYEDRQEQNDPG